MRRRDVIAAAAAAAFRPAHAAGQTKVVGILAPGPRRPIQNFKDRLRELGWTDGDNIRFEERWAEGDDGRYASLAAELARLPVDLIMTWSTPAVLAAKRATTTIPIVMGTVADPVGVGAVSNLAHPGGNVTGFSSQNFELEEKRFELLRELVPGLRRIAALGSTGNQYSPLAMRHVGKVAAAAAISVGAMNIDEEGGIAGLLAKLRESRPDGALVLAVPVFYPHRRELAEFMAANRLPAVYPFPEFVEAGGLIAYATNFNDLFRQAAEYVDRILRGAAPGDLPVQQAATFELIVNLKAARSIGLTIPQSVLVRAGEVIE